MLIRSLAALRSGASLLALLVVLSAGGPVLAGSSEAAAAVPAVCRGPVLQREADAAAIERHVKATGRKVLTFMGYSGAGYEDPAAMLRQAERILDRHDPDRTLVSIGATPEGIGAVYALARSRGFSTLGIVSSLARENGLPLSPCVETVFFVPDESWGGELPEGAGLAPTSAAVVGVSDEVVAIGGGAIARDELLAARRAGKPVTFIPADMNHRLAREKALRKGEAEPTSFRGEAEGALPAE